MKNNLLKYKERMLVDSEPLCRDDHPKPGDLVLVSDDGRYWSIARFNAVLIREVPGEPNVVTYETKPLDEEYTITYKMCRHIDFCNLPQILVKDMCGVAVLTRVVGIVDKDIVATTFGQYPESSIVYVDDIKFGGEDA